MRRRPGHRQRGEVWGRPPADDAGEVRGSGDGRKGTSRAASPLGRGEASRGGTGGLDVQRTKLLLGNCSNASWLTAHHTHPSTTGQITLQKTEHAQGLIH